MNDSTSGVSRAIPGLTIPSGARAVLVYETDDGLFKVQPVARDAALLNIERDLLKHLNDAPRSTEWLTILRDYCDQRIAARREARARGGSVTPSPRFDWDMTVIAARCS